MKHKLSFAYTKTGLMKKLITAASMAIIVSIAACGGNEQKPAEDTGNQPTATTEEKPQSDGKGVGEIKNVTLTDPLEADMIKRGKAIYDMKCGACHKLDAMRVVGPGWQNITNRRRPEWIMNMITNVEVMLEKDPAAQALLEECLTRMPNQNVSIGDARDILEFMRSNDMEKVGKKDEAVTK